MSQFINQNKYITIAAAAITLAVLGAAREAQAQARVLVLACPPAADTIAGQINAQPFHQLRATAGDLSAPGTLQQWMSYDALLISSDACIVGIDRAAFGDALADYVDTGRGVVEAVFTQVTNLNPTGRWSGDLYNLIAPNNNNVFSGSALGAISDPAHPLAQGVEALAVSNFRTGQSGLLPGAQAVMSYQDNQVLAAWRGDKAGRVAWLGFAPAEDSTLSGDTTRLMSNALAWVADANSAPTLTSPGAQASAEGQEITLALLADDADGDDLTFRATGLPPGLALGERDGIIRGTISYDASPQSPYSVTVTVSDGVAQAQVSVSWSVSDTNRAPLFPSPGDQTSAEGGNASIPMMATDPDGDALTFRAEGLPPGLSIHPQSGLVSGFLNFGVSAQSPYRATVTVRDGALETARTFFWRVTGTNRPPSLIDPGPLQVAEGASLDLALEATDPDGDGVTFAIDPLPRGASLDPNTWTLRWTPGFDQAGRYTLTVTATDPGGLSDTAPLELTVTNTNQPPAFASPPPLRIGEGQTLRWTVEATDLDGDEIQFSAAPLPPGAALDPATGAFAWMTRLGDAGRRMLTVTASDGLLSNTLTVEIEVTQAPAPPELTRPAPNQQLAEASPTLAGRAAPMLMVEVTLDGQLACAAVTDALGDFSCAAGLTLVDGAHEANALAIDADGVRGALGEPVPFVIDTVGPAPPLLQAPADGAPISDPRLTVRGQAPADARRVRVFAGAEPLCEAAVTDQSWSCAPDADQPEGALRLTARALDEAGNLSQPSAPVTVTLDLTAPLPPRLDSPAPSATLSAPRPNFAGVADPGAAVQVRVDGQSDRGCAATASPQGAWSCLGPDLEAGLHNADAVATDAAGNTSPPSLEIGFLVDLDGPDRPFISSPADGDQLSARAPAFQGSGEPGALLRVTLGALEVCAGVTINPQGQWACRAVVDLSDGPYTATATAADAFGRDSDPSPTVSFLIDTLAPAPPALTDPANDAILTNNQPTLSGDTEPLARVTLSLEGQADPLCDALADDQGAFSCISQQTLTEGAHRVVGVARDGAGNVSAPSAPSRFLVDTDGDADGDGLPNAWEEREGFDPLDPGDADDDPDEDGLTALQEFMAGTAPRDGDSDDDGVIDGVEPRWSEDTDGDGLINALDPDSDDDGLLDGVERGVLAPTRFTDSARGHFQADADPATTTDPLARDSDGGGAPDGVEDWDLNGRRDPNELDPTSDVDDLFEPGADDLDILLDGDEDGLSDLLEGTLGTDPADPDTDDDGLGDGLEANPSLDLDGDRLRAGLDPDSDDDGLPDGLEAGVAELPVGTDAARGRFRADLRPASVTGVAAADTDGDGLRDGFEDTDANGRVDAGESDPLDPASRNPGADADGDGLHDLEEARLGTDPDDDDSDDDGLRDGQERNAWDDHDGDGLINALDPDSDGDALLDGVEAGVIDPAAGTDLAAFRADADPNTRTGELLADTDGDGFADGDEDANGNGRLDGGESDPLDPRDPEQLRCDFDFQCTEALGDGFYCDTDARACVEGEPPPECVSDQDCEVAFGEEFACLEGRCERDTDEPDPDNNGAEPDNNGNNGAPPAAGDSGVTDEGCGCTLTPAPAPRAAWWLLLALAPLARPRRRR